MGRPTFTDCDRNVAAAWQKLGAFAFVLIALDVGVYRLEFTQKPLDIVCNAGQFSPPNNFERLSTSEVDRFRPLRLVDRRHYEIGFDSFCRRILIGRERQLDRLGFLLRLRVVVFSRCLIRQRDQIQGKLRCGLLDLEGG
jgi:hypothetical protein